MSMGYCLDSSTLTSFFSTLAFFSPCTSLLRASSIDSTSSSSRYAPSLPSCSNRSLTSLLFSVISAFFSLNQERST